MMYGTHCLLFYKLFIGLDKSGYQVNNFLISPKKICCGFSFNPCPAEPGYSLPLQTV